MTIKMGDSTMEVIPTGNDPIRGVTNGPECFVGDWIDVETLMSIIEELQPHFQAENNDDQRADLEAWSDSCNE